MDHHSSYWRCKHGQLHNRQFGAGRTKCIWKKRNVFLRSHMTFLFWNKTFKTSIVAPLLLFYYLLPLF